MAQANIPQRSTYNVPEIMLRQQDQKYQNAMLKVNQDQEARLGKAQQDEQAAKAVEQNRTDALQAWNAIRSLPTPELKLEAMRRAAADPKFGQMMGPLERFFPQGGPPVDPQNPDATIDAFIAGLGGQAPEAQRGSPSDFMQRYQEARAQGYKGTPLEFQKELTAAQQAPKEPQKPGYGQAQSGINPATGKPGLFVIDDWGNQKWLAGEPMPPSASLKDQLDADKVHGAKQRVSGNLEALRGYYVDLQNLGAVVDTRRAGAENVSAAIRASGPGQLAGKVLGTKEQSARNKINQMRPLLLQEIRQASQMGARGLDSNKELEFYLQAATDPARDIQANIAAMQVLENAYGLGGKIAGVDEKTGNSLKQEFMGTLPSVSSDAEYDALASGTEFVGPDGKRRVKP